MFTGVFGSSALEINCCGESPGRGELNIGTRLNPFKSTVVGAASVLQKCDEDKAKAGLTVGQYRVSEVLGCLIEELSVCNAISHAGSQFKTGAADNPPQRGLILLR